jgi:hypothetical protein
MSLGPFIPTPLPFYCTFSPFSEGLSYFRRLKWGTNVASLERVFSVGVIIMGEPVRLFQSALPTAVGQPATLLQSDCHKRRKEVQR